MAPLTSSSALQILTLHDILENTVLIHLTLITVKRGGEGFQGRLIHLIIRVVILVFILILEIEVTMVFFEYFFPLFSNFILILVLFIILHIISLLLRILHFHTFFPTLSYST